MIGVDKNTGKHVGGIDHLRQSIADILGTPIGSRVMRRDYGSRVFELIDRPVTQGFLVELYAAVVDALANWERRISVTRVSAQQIEAGRVSLSIEGRYLPEGKPITLEGIVL